VEDKTARAQAMNIVMQWCDEDSPEDMVDLLMTAIREAWETGFKDGYVWGVEGLGDE
jgi:hypothetical protein